MRTNNIATFSANLNIFFLIRKTVPHLEHDFVTGTSIGKLPNFITLIILFMAFEINNCFEI